MAKREKIKQIIINDSCGWNSSQGLLEKVTDNICNQLKHVPDNYEELLSAYIRLK
jgi:hypothetical protein